MAPVVESLNENALTIRQLPDGFSYIVFDNNRNTFVPKEVYQEKNKSKYLEILGLLDDDSVACSDFIETAEAYNVYAISKKDHEAAKKLTKDVELRHSSTLLLENLIKGNQERTDDTRIYLNVKDQCFEMMVLKGTELLFHNHFRFKTKEDFLYFLLFSMEQLKLDAETIPVYFMGMIEEDSKIVELTKRYVRDIRFKKDIKCES